MCFKQFGVSTPASKLPYWHGVDGSQLFFSLLSLLMKDQAYEITMLFGAFFAFTTCHWSLS